MLVVCIFIATVLWFLRALENNYTTHFAKSVEVTGLPENIALIDPVPGKVVLRVEGHGYSILRQNLKFAKTPLQINFNEIRPVLPRTAADFTEMVPTSRYISSFTSQMTDITILGITPDTLVLHFGKIVNEEVPNGAARDSEAAYPKDTRFLAAGL